MLGILTILATLGPLGPADPAVCAIPDGPPYYAIDLVTTRNVPGSGYASGTADVAASGDSPFSVNLTEDGSYEYDVAIQLERMRAPTSGRLVAWVTTPQIDEVVRIGALDENLQASGTVDWNQFLVVITWEAEDDPTATSWSGPIALRGISRSGMMHTMIGHGALQEENCASWGYSD